MRVTFQGTEMYIRTRCTDIDEVVELFTPFVEGTTIFVSTTSLTPPGTENAFRIMLANGAIVIRGRGVVRKVWSTAESPYRLPGLLLAVKRLTQDSEPIFARMTSSIGSVTEAVDPDATITQRFRVRFRNPTQRVSS